MHRIDVRDEEQKPSAQGESVPTLRAGFRAGARARVRRETDVQAPTPHARPLASMES